MRRRIVKKNFFVISIFIIFIVIMATLLIFFLLSSKNKRQGLLTPLNFKQNSDKVELYSKYEVAFQLPAKYSDSSNPFDLDEINISVFFISPANKISIVNAFYYQNYSRTLIERKEMLVKHNEPVWMFRFTPDEIGQYKYYITLNCKKSQATSPFYYFDSIESINKGFIRTSGQNFYYSNNELYFPKGMNIAWPSESGTYDYDFYFKKLNEKGMNFARIIMTPWSSGLEWSDTTYSSDYGGLGSYNLENAWKLDYILNLAQKYNISVLLSFDIYGELRNKSNDSREMLWESNPYNVKNKGFLKTPEEFFYNEKAMSLYKKRISYIISRYSYSTNILGWELWNEADLTDNYDAENVRKWHEYVFDYIKNVDPYNHLTTTSFADFENGKDIWSLNDVDFVHIHKYSSALVNDINYPINSAKVYSKPVLASEIGLSNMNTESLSFNQQELYDAIWLSSFETSGSGISWWWEDYINDNKLFSNIVLSSNFFETIPINERTSCNLEYFDTCFVYNKNYYVLTFTSPRVLAITNFSLKNPNIFILNISNSKEIGVNYSLVDTHLLVNMPSNNNLFIKIS
jgi:hypothetical protein